MLLDVQSSQLVLIDYQARLMPAIQDAAQVLAKAQRLVAMAQLLEVPIIGTEQVPDKLGPLLPELRQACSQVLAKTHFSAVPDGLRAALGDPADSARSDIVIAGCESHVCLLQTVLQLLQQHYRLWVVIDACGSRHRSDHDAALARMAAAGAQLVSSEMAGFEWLRDAQHPQFRSFQALIR